MKSPTIRITALATMLAMLALPALALSTRRVNATIPFAFNAGASFLPAGDYSIQKSGPAHLLVRNGSNEVVATVPARSLASRGFGDVKVELVFHRYGTDHFLSEIRAGAFGMSLVIQKSKVEREIEKRRQRYTVAVDAQAEP